MRLLHINSYLPTSTLYDNFYKILDFNRINQLIFVPNTNKNYINNIKLKNGKYIHSSIFNNLDRIIYFSKIYKGYKFISNNIGINNFDLIHAHSLFVNGGIAYRLFKNYNIDYIVVVQNTDINLFFKKLFHLRFIGRKILYMAKKIIFMTPSYKKRLISNYIPENKKDSIKDKSIVIPSGIDDYWLKNKNFCNKINEKIHLVYAGKINKNKNVRNICKVTQQMFEQGYKIDLKIIGKGPQKQKIKQYFSDNNYINILDYVQKEELLKYYRNSNIFIMPSYNETFGLVYIEAMSQGLPIIYTKNEGVDGYFDQGSVGYAVDPDDIDDMVEKIKIIAENYKEMSKNAVKEAQKFSWDIVSDKYIEIYEQLK